MLRYFDGIKGMYFYSDRRRKWLIVNAFLCLNTLIELVIRFP